MRIARRVSIALLAVLLAASGVANAVQMCVRDGFRQAHEPVTAEAAGHSHAAEPADAGVHDCCDMQAGASDPLALACCAVFGVDTRSAAPTAASGEVSALLGPAVFDTAYRGRFQAASKPGVPALRIAGPPLSILFRNFRS